MYLVQANFKPHVQVYNNQLVFGWEKPEFPKNSSQNPLASNKKLAPVIKWCDVEEILIKDFW